VDLPHAQAQHDVLATLWARTKIGDLMGQDFNWIQQGTPKAEVRQAITQLGLDYRLMTQFTSFVAVEETTITDGGQPRRIDVPVEIPEGVSYEGIFGSGGEAKGPIPLMGALATPPMASRGGIFGKAMEQRAFIETDQILEPQAEARSDTAKLDRRLAAIVKRLKDKNGTPAADEAVFVKDGKAEVQIWLEDTSAESLEQLKKLGFELLLQPKPGKLVIGRLPIEMLAALVELKAVRYIAPQLSTT